MTSSGDKGDTGETISRSRLLALFGRLDPAIVGPVFAAAAKALRVDGPELSLGDALHVLERMASESGAVGVTARFAKARLLLQVAATTGLPKT
jgi:hypothetical protein